MPLPPPIAKKEPTIHPYHWLKDTSRSGKRKDIEVHLQAEEAYAQEQFAGISALADIIYKEALAKDLESDQGVPYYKGNYYYYRLYGKGDQYSLYCRRFESMYASEQVYFNPNLFTEYKTVIVKQVAVSPSGKLLAYVMDTAGDEKYAMYFKNLETGKLLFDLITGSSEEVVWGNDDSLYMSQDDLLA
ncbi:hypothetical protein HK100_002868 [Physocladia obscura]|uniref:Peptidase S9A N-terminal domain-containing protein n=1 Tax=Physocladia obscura TaxID=109957 RepID=A0AAD5X9T8_9FUNG|nr:hypothetical protein HK100_002868 [Physocladia obscura]